MKNYLGVQNFLYNTSQLVIRGSFFDQRLFKRVLLLSVSKKKNILRAKQNEIRI